MVYLNFKLYWVFSESESQVDLKQPKAICLLSARKTVLDTDYIGSTKYNSTVNFRFKHVRFKEVFRFKEEFHCSQNFST